MSIRKPEFTRSDSDEVEDEVTTRVLDAARATILRHEGRRTTLAEVARDAGVSRPTVYRRWSDLTELMRDLLSREVARIVAAVTATIPLRPGPDFDAGVDQVVRVAAAMRDDELFQVLWSAQPEFMTPYVFDRLGASQRSLLQLIAANIAAAQRAGDVRPGDPDKLAAMVLLITQAAVQSASLIEPILGDDWTIELHHALRSYLHQPRVPRGSHHEPES